MSQRSIQYITKEACINKIPKKLSDGPILWSFWTVLATVHHENGLKDDGRFYKRYHLSIKTIWGTIRTWGSKCHTPTYSQYALEMPRCHIICTWGRSFWLPRTNDNYQMLFIQRSLPSAGHRSWQIRQPAAQSKLRELRQRARSACFVLPLQ